MQPTSPSSLPALHASTNGAGAAHHTDLESARRVQQRLFPCRLPRVPGWNFAGCCRPARSVGGDYYDLFEAGPGRVAVALGDVSGKGLGPALVMAHLHALVRGRLPGCPTDLPRCVAGLNDYLADFLPEDWFVTLFLAVLDLGTGRLRYVNAGHPAPLLLDGRGEAALPLSEGGIPLGVLPGADYQAGEEWLNPGSLLALFSDGLTEAHNSEGDMFRAWRVAEVLQGAPARPAGEVLAALLAGVEDFANGAEQGDDLTLVIVRRGAASAAQPGAGEAG
jgi:sigma-B regulation protein RsbU (phosphoserine phosphatase)